MFIARCVSISLLFLLIACRGEKLTTTQQRTGVDSGAPARVQQLSPDATPPSGVEPPPPKDIAALIAREEELNDKCRGGSGDNPATMKACDERDVLVKQLKAKGWCWGREDQYGYQKYWQKCSSK